MLITQKALYPCFTSLQVSLQNLPRQLTIVEMGRNNVVIGLPPWFKHTAALAGWLIQRHKGMRRVALGCPQEPIPEDDGTFSATHQVLSFMVAEEFGESFELVIFDMGMVAATNHISPQLQIDQRIELSKKYSLALVCRHQLPQRSSHRQVCAKP